MGVDTGNSSIVIGNRKRIMVGRSGGQMEVECIRLVG